MKLQNTKTRTYSDGKLTAVAYSPASFKSKAHMYSDWPSCDDNAGTVVLAPFLTPGVHCSESYALSSETSAPFCWLDTDDEQRTPATLPLWEKLIWSYSEFAGSSLVQLPYGKSSATVYTSSTLFLGSMILGDGNFGTEPNGDGRGGSDVVVMFSRGLGRTRPLFSLSFFVNAVKK